MFIYLENTIHTEADFVSCLMAYHKNNSVIPWKLIKSIQTNYWERAMLRHLETIKTFLDFR